MVPHTRSADLAELRARLYRPDPPEGAVDAYLDALHAGRSGSAPETPPAEARSRRRARGRSALATTAVLAAGLVVAMSLGHQASAVDIPPAGAAELPLPPVAGTPIGTLYGPGGTTGLFVAHGSPVVVSVDCSGTGTLDVRIGDEPVSVLTCEPGGPVLAMLPSREALDAFTVSIARHGAVRWSLTVGAEDLATA